MQLPKPPFSVSIFVAVLAGCVDNEGNFDDFRDRYLKIHDGGATADVKLPDAGDCPRTEGTSNDYFMSISTVLEPSKPIALRSSITLTSGGTAMDLSLQTYSAKDRKTLVGDAIQVEDVAVAENGTFETDTISFTLVGEADPIVKDLMVETEVVLKGGPVCDDTAFACGTVTGSVPDLMLPLEGSTFTAQLIEDETSLPEPLLDCARTPAAPLE